MIPTLRIAKGLKLDLIQGIADWKTGKTDEVKRIFQRTREVIEKTPNRIWYTFQYRALSVEIDKLLSQITDQPAGGKAAAKP